MFYLSCYYSKKDRERFIESLIGDQMAMKSKDLWHELKNVTLFASAYFASYFYILIPTPISRQNHLKFRLSIYKNYYCNPFQSCWLILSTYQ